MNGLKCMRSIDLPDAIILCGGEGLRLRPVTGDAPKSMATVAGRPFLDLLFRQLRRYGYERAILAVGYKKDLISSALGAQACDLRLAYATEEAPLGTGGAMRNASHFLETEAALVMNGDSYTDVDIAVFVEAHRQSGADLSVVIVPVDGRNDVGSVLVDETWRITQFLEKKTQVAATSYINAGIYIVSKALLNDIPSGRQISLEKELFPRWLGSGRYLQAFLHKGNCVDIGTPERYEIAQQLLAQV